MTDNSSMESVITISLTQAALSAVVGLLVLVRVLQTAVIPAFAVNRMHAATTTVTTFLMPLQSLTKHQAGHLRTSGGCCW
jgi:hypothetical protein